MADLEFDQLVLRYCRQIVMKTMDHVRGAMRGQNCLHLKEAVANPQHPKRLPFIAAKEPALAEQVLRLLKKP